MTSSASANEFGLTSSQRLRFVYFGLIVLGISNFIYRIKKPFAFRYGSNLIEYTKTCLEVFTLGDFVAMHNTIRSRGHLTLDGKYYDSEWDGFMNEARNEGEGTERVVRIGSWENAKSRYGSLLRSILRETFFRQNTGRRTWLAVCVISSTFGYLLLSIPSLDLVLEGGPILIWASAGQWHITNRGSAAANDEALHHGVREHRAQPSF